MDPRLIARLRSGQAEALDRELAARLRAEGLVLEPALAEAERAAPPGGLGTELVRRGLLETRELDRLRPSIGLEAVLEAAPPPLPGGAPSGAGGGQRRVGGYLLVQLLGTGGMGEVWKAWDGRLSRFVALKLLKADGGVPLERFVREARLVARLAHPGIPRLHEVDEDGGRPYLVMELVEGRTLAGLTLPRRRAAEVLRDAARAVQHAHDLGIVHRDLKPANLMESHGGRVSVLDFGLARALAGASDLTRPGSLLGTPNYMAPEQAQGLPADVRTDVYALGACLFALLEGRPPFEGADPAEVARRVAALDAPRLPDRDALDGIVNRALSRERAQRFPSAGALAEALEAWLGGGAGALGAEAKPAGGLLARWWARLRGRGRPGAEPGGRAQ